VSLTNSSDDAEERAVNAANDRFGDHDKDSSQLAHNTAHHHYQTGPHDDVPAADLAAQHCMKTIEQ
jgi:hypothetical protein